MLNIRDKKIRKEIEKLPPNEKAEVYLSEDPVVFFLKKRIAKVKKEIREKYKRFEY